VRLLKVQGLLKQTRLAIATQLQTAYAAELLFIIDARGLLRARWRGTSR
jgi:hypothetical protein